MLREHQIRILEWFLKDRVTLKTGVMMLEIHSCVTGISYIWNHIQIENSYFKVCLSFSAFIRKGQGFRQDARWERERERGGRNRETSTSWDSNSGRPECNGAICRHAAHVLVPTKTAILNVILFYYCQINTALKSLTKSKKIKPTPIFYSINCECLNIYQSKR